MSFIRVDDSLDFKFWSFYMLPATFASQCLKCISVDWKRMLNNQVDRLKKDVIETGKEVAKNAVDYIFDKIPCLASDVSVTSTAVPDSYANGRG